MRASYLFGDVATIASFAIQSFSLTTYFLRKNEVEKYAKILKSLKKFVGGAKKGNMKHISQIIQT